SAGQQNAAARALGRIGPIAQKTAGDLLPLLKNPATAAAASDALVRIGADSRTAVPALLDALESKDSPQRELLAAVVQFKQAAAPYLLARLKLPKSDARAHAVHLLGRIGAETAASAVQPLLKDANAEVRVEAARCLWLIARSPQGLP